MRTIVKYRPNIKPLSYFKNPNDRNRYECINMAFDRIERDLESFYELIDWCKEEIERLKNKTFSFWIAKRSTKRDHRVAELGDSIKFLEKRIEFNEKMYSFLADVLENPDKMDFLKVIKIIYDFEF